MHDRRRFLTAASALALTAWGAARAAPNASAAPAFADLGRELEGTLVQRTDAAYAAQRETIVWQRMKPARFPAAIVKAASVADVRKAVRFATDRGLRLSVRCGGHNFPGVTLQDGTLCLDVSALGGISVDPKRRIASIGPAVSGGEFLWHLEQHGLAFPAPHCGAVPLSGYLLGGGIGWNGDRWGGFACLNIEAVEIVTPDGELLTASPTENPDWYWLARGAGPLFCGVVTRFHLRLYPLPRAIMTSTFAWTFDELPEAADWLTEMATTLPLDVELLGVVGPGTPEAIGGGSRGSYLMSATAFADDAAGARALLEPIGRGDVVKRCVERTEFTPTPFEVLFEWDAAAFPWARWCADNIWSDARPPDVLQRLAGAFRNAPSPRSSGVCLFRRNRDPLPDAALSVRGGLYVAWYGSWDDPAHDRANLDWSAGTAAAVRDLAAGHYVNETDYIARPEQGAAAFSSASRARIARMRAEHDRAGTFHVPFGAGAT